MNTATDPRRDAVYVALWRRFSSEVFRLLEDLYLRPREATIDELQEFEGIVEEEIETVLADLTQRARLRNARSAAIAQKSLREACQILGLRPPKKGEPVNEKRARRAKVVLVKQYHPDVRGGDDALAGHLSATLEAYRRVVEYNRSLRMLDREALRQAKAAIHKKKKGDE